MSRELRGLLKRDAVPERFELLDVTTGRPVAVPLLEVAGAEFLIGDAVAHDEIRDFENLMPDGDHRFLVSAMALHPKVARLQRGLFRARRGLPLSMSAPRKYRLPARVLPLRRLPALSFCPGQIAAQL